MEARVRFPVGSPNFFSPSDSCNRLKIKHVSAVLYVPLAKVTPSGKSIFGKGCFRSLGKPIGCAILAGTLKLRFGFKRHRQKEINEVK
jgi:hypothetical protein